MNLQVWTLTTLGNGKLIKAMSVMGLIMGLFVMVSLVTPSAAQSKQH
jgi:hypothetical protein